MAAASKAELAWIDKTGFDKREGKFKMQDHMGVNFNIIPDLVLYRHSDQMLIFIDFKDGNLMNTTGKGKGYEAAGNEAARYMKRLKDGYGGNINHHHANLGYHNSIYQKVNILQCYGMGTECWIVDSLLYKGGKRKQAAVAKNRKATGKHPKVKYYGPSEALELLQEDSYIQIDHWNVDGGFSNKSIN
jgi:hypothetical protein